MSVLVVGSVAYDSVSTSVGSRGDALGGSAMYFSISSSYFTPVSLVAVVGDDFLDEHVELLKSHDVDVSGLERRHGKTFRWSGVYGAEGLNTRETLDTQLNVFADFSPRLDARHSESPYLFLANIEPGLQLDVLDQMKSRPKIVALDTMNFWIDGSHDSLKKIVERVDVVFMDEGEVRTFAGEVNLIKAAKRITAMGPSTVVVKRGEHGVLVFNGGTIFVAPAFPLETVVDPTGAGDSFAGGFMGYLASTGDIGPEGMRRAAVLGSVMGSFAVESFSADRISSLSKEEIDGRFRAFADLSHFAALKDGESLPWRNDRK